MGTIINYTKNFIQSLWQNDHDREHQENLTLTPEEVQVSYSSHHQKTTFLSSRKRTAEIFEPEITDDEDEFGFSGGGVALPSKKARSEIADMSKRDLTSRSSGIPPGVEASKKLPWDFKFFSRYKPRAFTDSITGPSEPVAGPSRAISSSIPGSSRFTIFREQTTPEPTNEKKKIEVITIDDDAEVKPLTLARRAPVSIPPSKKEMEMLKPRVSNSMKLRTRDDNKFTKAFASFGSRITAGARSVAYRLQEKDRYKQLLMAYNVMGSNGGYEAPSALTKSKVDHAQLQVLYSRFGSSPTEGAVSFEAGLRRSLLPTRQSRKSIMGGDKDMSKALLPKLFSTPEDLELMSPTPRSKLKALTYSKPELIDLEEEKVPSSITTSKELHMLSPITASPLKRKEVKIPSPEKGNFSNLDEAFNASGLQEPTTSRNQEIVDVEATEEEDGTDDLSIIAEKVVDKSRRKSVNTLALEQTLCPYVQKKWLENSQLPWKERQKLREERIREEQETLNVLRRDSTLEKDLNQRIRDKLTLTEIIVLDEPPAQLPDLTEEMMTIINNAKRRGNDNEVLAQVRLPKDTIDITRGDIKTLGPLQWLNDNVINTYLGLIVLRSKNMDNFPTVYAFQTFFYPKLLKEGYSNSLKRWTRKDDIFGHDLIILPIHLGLHWCLACVDLRKKSIKYFDSMGSDNNKCLNSLLDYLSREMKERKQQILDKSEWTLENVKGIPQQHNGSDCGMFACKFAEYLSRDAKFTFTQENMPYFRDRMIYELLKAELLYP